MNLAQDQYVRSPDVASSPCSDISRFQEPYKMSIEYLLNVEHISPAVDIHPDYLYVNDENADADLLNMSNDSTSSYRSTSMDDMLTVARARLETLKDEMIILSPQRIEDILRFFQRCLQGGLYEVLVRNPFKTISYLAASIVVTCRYAKEDCTFDHVCKMFHHAKKPVVQAYSDITLIQSNQQDNLSGCTISLCKSVAMKLNFNEGLIQDCLRELPRYSKMFDGRSSRSVVAITVLSVGLARKVPDLTRKQVAAVSGVSSVTLWTLCKRAAKEFERNQ